MLPVLRPMLATPAEPFDSADYRFEVKWDGIRALTAVEGGRLRLWGRERADYRDRYPELQGLRSLPSGTLLDGELVALCDGRAELNRLLRRHHLSSPWKIQQAQRHTPVRYILFDILYYHGRSLLDEPFKSRQAALEEWFGGQEDPLLMLCRGTEAAGKKFFAETIAQGHEGVVAKHVSGRYRPGQRSASWRKIKPVHVIPCVVIGYTPGPEGFHSLLVAASCQGTLRYVGELTCGFTASAKAEGAAGLRQRPRSRPIVACPKRAQWVEPEWYCQVQFLGWTAYHRLHGASFQRWIAPQGILAPLQTGPEAIAP